jgi:hypothetical protein
MEGATRSMAATGLSDHVVGWINHSEILGEQRFADRCTLQRVILPGAACIPSHIWFGLATMKAPLSAHAKPSSVRLDLLGDGDWVPGVSRKTGRCGDGLSGSSKAGMIGILAGDSRHRRASLESSVLVSGATTAPSVAAYGAHVSPGSHGI